MVCDTSSVLMMFLLLNKPVVTYQNISPGNFLIDIDSAHLLESSIERALSPLMKNGSGRHKNTKSFDLVRQLKMRKKLNY
jgi:CDP-glycerol glycerophosphotransferase (TagB/SpsB family)